MKSLQDVLEAIAGFVRDMDALGVEVDVALVGDPSKTMRAPDCTLLAVLKMKLEEEEVG